MALIIRVKAFVVRGAEKNGDGEAFEGLAIFVRDLTGNDAFGSELQNGGRGAGSELK